MLENPTQENPTQLSKEVSRTDLSSTQKSNTHVSNTNSIPILSPYPSPSIREELRSAQERNGKEADSAEKAFEIYRTIIEDNIEYDILIQDPHTDREQLDEIVDLMLETVCSARKAIRVAGDDYPAEIVKAKLLKLNSMHIQFVFDCLRENTTKIRNFKKYLLAVLFNAPSTINGYYTALVAHDMANGFFAPNPDEQGSL